MPDPVIATPASPAFAAPVAPSPSADPTVGMSLEEGMQLLQTGQLPAPTPSPEPQPAQPAPGQAAPAAPEPGQGGEKGATPQPNAAAPEPGQAPAEVPTDKLLAELGQTETPDAQIARLTRDNGASRKEALRLKTANERLTEMLAEQKLEIVLDADGTPRSIAPAKGYAKDTEFSPKFTAFSEAEQERFEKDPQALMDHVLNEAKRAFVRAAPTVEKAIRPISPEQEQAAIDHVAQMFFQDGKTLKHPRLKHNLPVIKQYLDGPQNAALKEFMYQQPDLAYSMLDSFVESARAFFASAAADAAKTKTEKQQEAEGSFLPGPAGGGVPVVVGTGATPEQIGDAIGKRLAAAKPW